MKKRTIPFGYEIRNGLILPEPSSAKIVIEIYNQYLNGQSFQSIATALTQKQIDYFDGKTEWNKQMIKRILEFEGYCGSEKYPQIIESHNFQAVSILIAKKYSGYNTDPRAVFLKKRTFCQECGERLYHDVQNKRYHRWKCRQCTKTVIAEEDFYKKIVESLNTVIEYPELLDKVETGSTYESEFEIIAQINALTHMLNSPNVHFETALADILSLAALKYDHCKYDITEELTKTIKSDFIGKTILSDMDLELMKRTVSHITINASGAITVHFINGATIQKEEGENDDRTQN